MFGKNFIRFTRIEKRQHPIKDDDPYIETVIFRDLSLIEGIDDANDGFRPVLKSGGMSFLTLRVSEFSKEMYKILVKGDPDTICRRIEEAERKKFKDR